jgi:arylsulfatase A-like enzyme
MKAIRHFAWAALLLAATMAVKGAPTPPNLLLIVTDDQGRGDYSAYGTRDLQTPSLDRLFQEGMTFDNFYANSCVCSPTRAALLTGCHPDRVGVPGVIRSHGSNSWGHLDPRARLLPQYLKQAGYRTALVGKWHLGLASPNLPRERGFDHFHGFLGDMMDDYYTHLRHDTNYLRHNDEDINPTGHATDLFADWASEWLATQTPAQPFFLYLAFNAPHDPIQPPPEWLEKVRKREPGLSPKRAKLVALIEHLDAGIGRVLATLKERGLEQNTLILYTSDNGGVLALGANNGPWRSGKQHLYEGGLRVPCAVRWPGHITAGSQTARTALSMDIFPTFLEAAGLPIPSGIDGRSFLPVLRSEQVPALEREYYFVRREGGAEYGGKTIEALRSGDWKLVQDSPFAPLELFNLRTDPGETNNLFPSERAVARQLSERLRHHIQRGGAVPWQD